MIEVVGQKRKMNSRGPGRESFKSSRACVASSQQLSNPIIKIIETQYQNCCVLIISALKTIVKFFLSLSL